MRRRHSFPLVALCFGVLLTGCSGITMAPIHDPVYPASNQNVTYALDIQAGKGISTVELFETVSTVSSTGTVTPGTESLVKQWTPAGSPTSTTITYTKSGGYPANRLVRYRFRVKAKDNKSLSYDITYAIRPYPVANQAAPIYVQGDVDSAFDIVFIPDTDIPAANMNTFRNHCRLMITDAMFDEPKITFWRRSFNFYINPSTGTATDYDKTGTDGYHQKPSNWAQLSFAEAKCLMHQNNLRDYATGDLFSTEMQNRGTMLHEAGHSLFGLADEYAGGVHWQAAECPNNWKQLADAQAEAPKRGKTKADAVQIGTDPWYKICAGTCSACVSGVNASTFDACACRISYSVIKNAMGN